MIKFSINFLYSLRQQFDDFNHGAEAMAERVFSVFQLSSTCQYHTITRRVPVPVWAQVLAQVKLKGFRSLVHTWKKTGNVILRHVPTTIVAVEKL